MFTSGAQLFTPHLDQGESTMRRSMLWSLTLLAFCVPPSLAQPIKDPATVMPANVLVYGEVRQPGELVKEFVSLFENSMFSNVPESLFKMMEEMKAPPPRHGFE